MSNGGSSIIFAIASELENILESFDAHVRAIERLQSTNSLKQGVSLFDLNANFAQIGVDFAVLEKVCSDIHQLGDDGQSLAVQILYPFLLLSNLLFFL